MIEPVIKWSGSKRSQAGRILKCLPDSFNRYYEPFVGGGSIMYAVKPHEGYCGDICKPLIELWNLIKEQPQLVATHYKEKWEKLQAEGEKVYYDTRDNFNSTKSPTDLLFLTRTCVNGLIRFNKEGDFNNSFHHTRPGINPDRLERIVMDWSKVIQNTSFACADYRETTSSASKGDVVYLDPPYLHTKGRYYGGIDFDEFINYLYDLKKREVSFVLSFDGKRGEDSFIADIPEDLYSKHILIGSGKSSFKKVIDRQNQEVYESLYIG